MCVVSAVELVKEWCCRRTPAVACRKPTKNSRVRRLEARREHRTTLISSIICPCRNEKTTTSNERDRESKLDLPCSSLRAHLQVARPPRRKRDGGAVMGSALSFCCASEKAKEGTTAAGGGTDAYGWRVFTYKELHAATNGFHEDNKLGEGGFGSVYWGKTADGLQIAVKKLKTMNSKAEMEFAVEVEVLGRVRHRNLLGLRGYCVGADQRLIVYDFMPNLSLLSHLHGQFKSDSQLDWKRRMAILLGSAEGLAYLHHEVTPHIIHRDVKASNVLLDSDFRPLVADFGFAKLVPDGVSHMTTRVKGTLGYLAPEYAMWGKLSEACDVYSFGILLLELVSGRKPIERLPGGAKRTITEWAEPVVAQGRFKDLADPRLRGDFDEVQLGRAVAVAALCVQGDPERRPRMRDVVALLRGDEPPKAAKVAVLKQAKLMESVKYEDDLLSLDQASSDDMSAVGGSKDQEEEESSTLGVFGRVETQRMLDPYVLRDPEKTRKVFTG
ncbi:hypothetical protein Taro_040738 [Colocasia esculenta]|uniref:Protein kinase domain-containing protein n=1 Tax=Colocasia esculenta TaxID=4460 RepID=A0A843WTV7_COLES|nr:hypothetical protein [Colocasia esculenta]